MAAEIHPPRSTWQFLVFLILAIAVHAPVAIAADRYALVVGVSEYPRLDPAFGLCDPNPARGCGPRNDATQVRDVLTQRGFQADDISMLVDGLDGAGEPTIANIHAAMDHLVERTKSGDTVFFYFSGHGSQQPATDASDPEDSSDGWDEIFLTSDTSGWNGKRGVVDNALVDNDVDAFVRSLNAKDVFVWAVFDSCHSGTMLRGGSGKLVNLKYRVVTPRALGVPRDLKRTKPSAGKPSQPPNQVDAIRGVAFYATHSNELAPQATLPDASGRSAGVFTYMLVDSLRTAAAGTTYRELMERTIKGYRSAMIGGATPYAEGIDVDEAVIQ